MTSITLNSQTTSPAAQPSIGSALRELAVAGRHLSVALLSTLQRDRAASRQQLSAFQEAEELRTYAQTLLKTDPGFASDLFAAADRHELTHGA
jgi:hypothetical protein